MVLKFAANLSFMFAESATFTGKYNLAKQCGFKAVESGFPLGYTVSQVSEAKKSSGLEQILINVFTGDVTKGELGFTAIPGKEKEFRDSIDLTIEYAKALNCKMIHVMSGKVENPTAENDNLYEQNLLYAVKKFQENGIVGLIEPINPITVPNYYMNNFDKGFSVVKKINSPHLRLMLDLFHLQQVSGRITKTIRDNIEYIGHIQIAQVPDRNEPDTPGEISYKYIFDLLEQIGYSKYIGLEYKPKASTADGLKWLQNLGQSL